MAVRILLVLLAACGASAAQTAHKARSTDGSIAGLVRDHESGEPLGTAELALSNGRKTTAGGDGLYLLDHVKPGRYSLIARFAGHFVITDNIEVRAGEPTFVDVMIVLTSDEGTVVDLANRKLSEITRFKPKDAVTRIEGTVTELVSRERVAGVVVTAARGREDETLQTVTDDQGRFRFDHVDPGTYAVSAYYSIGGRAQIEVRRSDVHVERGEGVMVPLEVETRR